MLHTSVMWVPDLDYSFLNHPLSLALITVSSLNRNETIIGNSKGICIIHQRSGDVGFARARWDSLAVPVGNFRFQKWRSTCSLHRGAAGAACFFLGV